MRVVGCISVVWFWKLSWGQEGVCVELVRKREAGPVSSVVGWEGLKKVARQIFHCWFPDLRWCLHLLTRPSYIDRQMFPLVACTLRNNLLLWTTHRISYTGTYVRPSPWTRRFHSHKDWGEGITAGVIHLHHYRLLALPRGAPSSRSRPANHEEGI